MEEDGTLVGFPKICLGGLILGTAVYSPRHPVPCPTFQAYLGLPLLGRSLGLMSVHLG